MNPSIKEDYEKLKGQIVMTDTGDSVRRFLGIVSDDYDFYYVLYDGRKISLYSCVGGLIQLKGKIDDKDYNGLKRICQLNHWDLIGDDVEQIKTRRDISNNLTKENTIELGLYWELN